MVLNALKFDPKVQGNPFAPERVAFTGGEQKFPETSGVEAYGTGIGINGTNSSGVHGEVMGTGENGKHKLNMYF